MRKVKIVCTLGPSTAGVPRLKRLLEAGMDVARLNFSHGTHEEHRRMYLDVRAAAAQAGKPLAVIGDLCGPKIRVGRMQGGGVELKPGQTVVLTVEERVGDGQRIPHSYPPLSREAKPGDRILLDDGMLEFVVESLRGDDVFCRVVTGGVLKDHKGMNLPTMKLSAPALTVKDREDLSFARELGVDYLALSFVRTPEDVLAAKELADGIPVIAKIEKPEAVARIEEILGVADGAMVARGDLGVEAGPEKVPLLQKRIIRDVKKFAKPVITATQMLDSMIRNPRPTRAEVSDAANAVLDGTDAVMLSGETSVGQYPVEAVQTLQTIIEEIESNNAGAPDGSMRPPRAERGERRSPAAHAFSGAIADACVEVSRGLKLAALAVYTETGRSAALVSAQRPEAGVIAFSRHPQVLNRMALLWGVKPLNGQWVKGVDGVVVQAETELLKHGLVKPGDDIAVTFGMVIGDEPFQTNILKLWKIRNP
ncbi:MAG: pyruvate kinase [Syntrophales bacterium]|jgi:pyruvate kinase|nr:pyruvate kinase [Syntrophales bacterium]